MSQAQIENEIQRRLYLWAQATIRREVAEDFPILRNCQHDRRTRCFLAWMNTLNPAERLRICLLLATRNYEQLTLPQKRDADAGEAFEQCHSAMHRYDQELGPEPDYDDRAPGFVKADIEKCKEAIYAHLQFLCGPPRRRQRQKIWYIQKFGDWFLTTLIEMSRGWGPEVFCYHFLRRADFADPVFRDSRYYAADMVHNIDPLILFGVSWCNFPLMGRSHEELCAKSVLVVTEPIVRSIPKLIEGLEIQS
jgi:hypothetical protein